MSIKITGDFEAKFNRWTALLNDAKVIVSHSSRAAAEVSIALIAEGFDTETDPYGERWAPKKQGDGRKILHGETTRLRNGWHVQANDDGFTVNPSVEYAAYHQEGTSRMPARKMVPDGSRGLPHTWVEEYEAIAAAAVVEHFKEAASMPKPAARRRGNIFAAGGGGGVGRRASHSAPKQSRSVRKIRTARQLRGR